MTAFGAKRTLGRPEANDRFGEKRTLGCYVIEMRRLRGMASRVAAARRPFPGARDDIGLDCTHLVSSQNFPERRHATRRARATQNNSLNPFQCLCAGIAQIGHRPGDYVRAMAGRAIVVEQDFSLMQYCR